MRGQQLGRLACSAAAARSLRTSGSAAAAAHPALALFGSCLPASPGADCPPGSLAALNPANAGLTLQQSFAAHSLAQLGGGAKGVAAAPSGSDGPSSPAFEINEVTARLREHLEAAFIEASSPPPAGMCAPPSSAQLALPMNVGARAAAQSVAARLTKHKHAEVEVPHTLEGAMQPSQQARVVVEAQPPFRLAWANPAWEELSGLEWAAVVGEPCLAVVPAGRQLADALAAHARISDTLCLSQSDAAPLQVQVTTIPLLARDGFSNRMLLAFTPTPAPAGN